MTSTPTEHIPPFNSHHSESEYSSYSTARNVPRCQVHKEHIWNVQLRMNLIHGDKLLNTFRCHNWVSKQPCHPGHNYKSKSSHIISLFTILEMTTDDNLSQFTPEKKNKKNRNTAFHVFMVLGTRHRCNSVSWPPKTWVVSGFLLSVTHVPELSTAKPDIHTEW